VIAVLFINASNFGVLDRIYSALPVAIADFKSLRTSNYITLYHSGNDDRILLDFFLPESLNNHTFIGRRMVPFLKNK